MGRAAPTCAVPRTKQAAGGKLPCNIGSSARSRVGTERRGTAVGGRQAQEGGDICTHTADPRPCTAEANTTLQSNYTPININKIQKIIFKKKEAFGLETKRLEF